RHTRCLSDWSSDVCSSDLPMAAGPGCQPVRRSPRAGRAALITAELAKDGWSRPDGAAVPGPDRKRRPAPMTSPAQPAGWYADPRSEERRVGKEGRAGEGDD